MECDGIAIRHKHPTAHQCHLDGLHLERLEVEHLVLVYLKACWALGLSVRAAESPVDYTRSLWAIILLFKP